FTLQSQQIKCKIQPTTYLANLTNRAVAFMDMIRFYRQSCKANLCSLPGVGGLNARVTGDSAWYGGIYGSSGWRAGFYASNGLHGGITVGGDQNGDSYTSSGRSAGVNIVDDGQDGVHERSSGDGSGYDCSSRNGGIYGHSSVNGGANELSTFTAAICGRSSNTDGGYNHSSQSDGVYSHSSQSDGVYDSSNRSRAICNGSSQNNGIYGDNVWNCLIFSKDGKNKGVDIGAEGHNPARGPICLTGIGIRRSRDSRDACNSWIKFTRDQPKLKVGRTLLLVKQGDVIMSDKDAEHSDVNRFSQSSELASTVNPAASVVSPPSSEVVEEDENVTTATANGTVSMPCGHKFCLFCMPVVNRAQQCLLCLGASSELTPPCSGHSTSSSTIFSDLSHTDIAQVPVEQAFSIWNPITPKSASKSQRMSKYMIPSVLDSGVVSTSPVSSHLTPGTAQFSMPPPLMSQTINWHTAPRAEIQTPFERTYPRCTMCAEDNAIATARCIQCEETLCGECVAAHHRVRMTRDHTLVSVEPYKGFAVPQVVSGSECFKVDELVEGETCNTHDASLLCMCTTCGGVGLCHMCISEHPKHPLVPHGDLRTAVLMLIAGSKHDQKNVEDAIETVRRMSERIEASVQSVMRELRSVIHIHISALEERKRDLLQRVDTIRQSKMSVLKAQGERLALRLTSLSDALKVSL
uniref:B box-type domain-containing protein n=1 Tax=Parascaris univalens TaxID=6257 RepID=A0A915AEM8_PARUN